MSDTRRLLVFGTSVDAVVDDPLAEHLLHSLDDLRAGDDDGSAGPADHLLTVHHHGVEWAVSWDGADRYRGPEADLALYDALIALNHHAAGVAAESGASVLHGGAVAIGGRAVVVVGHSGRGKSTLTTALTRAGHPFLADEVVAVDAGFVVRAFHRPIGLRRGGAATLGLAVPEGPYGYIHPYRVGERDALATSAPLALAALLVRDDEAETPRLERLASAVALFQLANQALGTADLEREMFRRLDTLVRRIPVFELHYAEIGQAVALLEDVEGWSQTELVP